MIALMISKGVNFFGLADNEEEEKKKKKIDKNGDDEVTNTSEAFNELTNSDEISHKIAHLSFVIFFTNLTHNTSLLMHITKVRRFINCVK